MQVLISYMKHFLRAGFVMFVLSVPAFAQQDSAKKTGKEILITTEFGNIRIRLYDQTPKHRDNFIKLASEGFFNDLLFHRVIQGFMIQGGDPNSRNAKPGEMLGNGDVGYYIPAEFNDSLFHKKGVIAAARDNNPEKASSGCQFYIAQGKVYTDEELNTMEIRMGRKIPAYQREVYKTTGGIPHLDQGYTVFGEVLEGLDVLDKIAAVPTNKAAGDRPLSDVRMKIKVIK